MFQGTFSSQSSRLVQFSRLLRGRNVQYVVVGRLRRSGDDEGQWELALFRHIALVRHFHVILHLIWPRELFPTHRAGEDFALRAFVVQEGVSLETVLVLECLLHVLLGTLGALVHSVLDACVAEEVETAN